MASITIMWDDNTTSAITDVRDFAPRVPNPPTERIGSTGKPTFIEAADNAYVYGLAFNIPCHQCSATVVSNFLSHRRDITKDIYIFDDYTKVVYKGLVKGIPAQFFVRRLPQQMVRFEIQIAVKQEGTYTGTAGSGASITWRN